MRRSSSLILLTTAAVLLAGCATGAAEPSGSATTEIDAGPALKWAAVTGEPPISFTDENGQSIGMDPDLAQAIAAEMGRAVEVMPEAFQNSLLGLDANRLDVVGGASVTPARIEKYDMVPYSEGAYGMLTRADDGADIPDSLDELCGFAIAINAGDFMIATLKEKSDQCVADGKPALEINEFPDATANGLAVQSGRVDAWVGPTIALGYADKSDEGKWERTGPEWGNTIIGFVTLKGSGLAEEIAAALNTLIENGTYEEIMDSYGLTGNMIDESVVNPDLGDPGE